jgi:aryl-alcohol dehydrogenase-like predicted oxidoreductase
VTRMSPIRATPAGTRRYGERFTDRAADFFRPHAGLTLSSIGLGTYLGPADDATQRRRTEAIAAALRGGCNVIDTAINYGHMRSERAVGQAIRRVDADGIGRNEIIVTTKGGTISCERQPPTDLRSYIETRYIRTGMCQPHDIVAASHCFAPGFLREQLKLSLENLGLGAVDFYLLHNPEIQLSEMPHREFLTRMARAFECLEEEARSDRIQYYGIATWHGLRVRTDDRRHIVMLDLIDVAERVGGRSHRFKVVQLPFNMAMTEALLFRNQRIRESARDVSTLEFCRAHGLIVMTSASIGQGQLAGMPMDLLKRLFSYARSPAQALLQFARSAPGVTTSLVGTANMLHVAENLELVKFPCVTSEISNALADIHS